MEATEGIGPLVRRLRRAKGWSQGRLAERLSVVSGRDTVGRHDVYRWEAGKRLPRVWLPALADALGVPRETLELACAGAPLPDVPAAPLEYLLPADLGVLQRTAVNGEAPTGSRIGAQEVEDIFGRIHGLRLADDVISGGDLMGPAFRELLSTVRLYKTSRFTTGVGNRMLVAIGELGQIAGWIASDAGRYGQAEQAYRLGLSAASQAGDITLSGNLIGSLAYQYANTGRPGDAVTLTSAVLDTDEASTRARALAHDRAAWALTRVNDSAGAIRALGEASEALASAGEDSANDPSYLYWVGDAELQVMEARCYTELGRPLRAVPLLTTILARYDASHARELALYLSWLSIAYLDANEPEAAAQNAARMITLGSELASERLMLRTKAVLDRLRTFQDIPDVKGVLDLHREMQASVG